MKADKELEKKSTTEGLSHSKQKRIDREKKNAKKKSEAVIGTVVGIVIGLAVVGVIAWGIVSAVIKASSNVVASSDYSAQLDDNGFVKGVKASNSIDLCNYKGIEVPLSEIEYSDESVEADIQSALEQHQVLVDEDVEVKDGDKVSIDYVGTIDGVEFEGGNSNGSGYDLTIGSGSFIDDFEQQLIGYKPGEVAIVNVTFPEDYSTEDLQGKDAEFTVEVHGVYVNPEFDDDFVAAYYGDVADTAEGYRQYLKDTNYESNLTDYVANYLQENTTVNKYPKAYLKNVMATTKYMDEQSYDYMNQMYMQYYGSGFSSFEEYTGKTMDEYNADLETESKDTVKTNLIYQAILEYEGVVPTVEDLKAQFEINGTMDSFDSSMEEYGQGYMMIDVIKNKALAIAKENVVVK